jgi:acyl transferase domain-containing protein
MVVLKRLSDAVRDDDPILALVHAWASIRMAAQAVSLCRAAQRRKH